MYVYRVCVCLYEFGGCVVFVYVCECICALCVWCVYVYMCLSGVCVCGVCMWGFVCSRWVLRDVLDAVMSELGGGEVPWKHCHLTCLCAGCP